MPSYHIHSRVTRAAAMHAIALALFNALALASGFTAHAQQPASPDPAAQPAPSQPQAAPQPQPQSQPTSAPRQPETPAPATSAAPNPPREISEEEIRQMLLGKPLILRGGYQSDTLRFNEHGALIDSSPRGPFTLSGIQIDRVRLSKHKLELEGARYALRFQGSDPNSIPTGAADRVRITPKKKSVKITIDRELVVAAKKTKLPKVKNKARNQAAASASAPAPSAVQPAQPPAESGQPDEAIAQTAAPESERPADPASLTTTTSPQHAAALLRSAIERIFADGISDLYLADLPEYWKIYFQNLAAGKDFKPSDPSVLRQRDVDRKARLVSILDPKSNELAQAHDVAGIALIHTVIGPDGKPAEIALGQPIGFGLDENAVAAIRNATFEPAVKNGKPVAVALDLTVQFHIYSKLTSETQAARDADKAPASSLPGPYSANPH